MKSYPIITIGRQYGSGGREIGRAVAERLGIPYYDNELITMAAEESGFAPELFRNADKNASNSFLFSLSMYGVATGNFTMPLADRVFLIQSDIIRKVAAEGPCVIVGRCADYILRDEPNCLSVFFHAPLAFRMQHAVAHYEVEEAVVKEEITKTDKKRSVYYLHFTGGKWGQGDQYQLTLDTGALGIDTAAEILVSAATAVRDRQK